MRCVILGAGLGTRMKPLTLKMPKPMLPIANRPVLEHLINKVRNAGIKDILINTYHLPGIMKSYFGDGKKFGVNITWREEELLTGPAGALLNFKDILENDDSVLVLSGDGIHDIDLEKFIEEHKSKMVQLSVVMKEVSNPGRYGVAKVDSRNMIVDFVEKPPLPEESLGLVSCGVYCLDPKLIRGIPFGEIYDYSNLIEELLSQEKSIYCYKTIDYWSDIGTPTTLLEANRDALLGKVNVKFPDTVIKGDILVEKEVDIDSSVTITGKVLFGKGSKIGENVHIIGPTVIGAKSTIGNGSYISNSVLLPESNIPANTVISGKIIDNSQVEE
ncbi:NDP-sugar synthase [Bacillus thuringiensis]|uniref:NDP-sugar synthase n=1 Tax=Bacillus thuringiensis TaxID=1428 RepID=UPI003337BE25